MKGFSWRHVMVWNAVNAAAVVLYARQASSDAGDQIHAWNPACQEEKEVGGKNSERTFKSIFKSSYPVKSNDQQHYDSRGDRTAAGCRFRNL